MSMHPPGIDRAGMHPPGIDRAGMHPPGIPHTKYPPIKTIRFSDTVLDDYLELLKITNLKPRELFDGFAKKEECGYVGAGVVECFGGSMLVYVYKTVCGRNLLESSGCGNLLSSDSYISFALTELVNNTCLHVDIMNDLFNTNDGELKISFTEDEFNRILGTFKGISLKDIKQKSITGVVEIHLKNFMWF